MVNSKVLLAATTAGLLVGGAVHWWNGREGETAPRTGCTTVFVAASVEKSDLIADVAKRYNASDRRVNGNCDGISIEAAPSGVAGSRLAEASWEPSWGPAPNRWSPAASTWLQLLRHDRAAHDRPDILAADSASVVSTPVVLAMPEPMAKALGWPDTPIGWSDCLHSLTRLVVGRPRAPGMGLLQAGQDQPQRLHIWTVGDHRRLRGGHRHVQ